MTDPLQRLVVNQHEVDRELLATVLEPYVTIDPSHGTFAYRKGVRDSLANRERVLVALLSRKALALLGSKTQEAAQPRQLEELAGIKGGTLRPLLRQLVTSGVLWQDDRGYAVPNHSLHDIADSLSARGWR
jgi:hypothetical protein